MGIGITKKNNMLPKILGILFLMLVCFSCKTNSTSQNISHTISNPPCKLHQKDFDIASDGFKEFNLQLNNFFKTKNKYDVLKIFMKGGNHEKSFLKRWLLDENKKWVQISQKNKIETKHYLKNVPSEIDSLISLVQEGSFMQECVYNSNNDSYLLLIKDSGKIKFQYMSMTIDSGALSDLDNNRIDAAIKVFSFFEKGI